MRKDYIYIAILILSIIGVVYGILDLVKMNYNSNSSISINNKVENLYEESKTINTSIAEKKVSPNCNFALKKYYDECNHFEYEEVELPKELINLTRQEVEDFYEDWEVGEFTDNSLVLIKEINGYCDEHFFIKLDDKNINIYKLDTQGNMELYKQTDIFREYLPIEDIQKLEQGIAVFGKGKISSILEDYE